MEKFWELVKESVIVQGLMSLTMTVTVCILYLQGRSVPTELFALLGCIIGFYFGGKMAQYTLTKGK
jgi:hypothetical protein